MVQEHEHPGSTATESRFARTFDALESIYGFAESFCDQERIDKRHRFAIHFALEEIFTNMVKYNDGKHEIRIGLRREGDRLRIAVTDFDVPPFDVTRVTPTETDVPLEERRIGGLGLQLTKQVMDAIDYDHSGRDGTVTLTKFLE